MFSTPIGSQLSQPSGQPHPNPFSHTSQPSNPSIFQTTNPLATQTHLQPGTGLMNPSTGTLGIGNIHKQHSDYKGYH